MWPIGSKNALSSSVKSYSKPTTSGSLIAPRFPPATIKNGVPFLNFLTYKLEIYAAAGTEIFLVPLFTIKLGNEY